jgi:hypothetical protein
MEDEELQVVIEHQKTMLKHLRQQLRDLEIQEVKFGITVPTHILEGLRDTRTRIEEYQAELARLNTLAAEDQFSVKEAEYNVLLAEAWSKGRPNVTDVHRLELLRLRLGISPQRATELAEEVKRAIAEELLETLGRAQIDNFLDVWHGNTGPLATSIRILHDALLIHPIQAAQSFFGMVGCINSLNGVNNLNHAFEAARTWRSSPIDQASYTLFLEELDRLNRDAFLANLRG